MCNRCWICVDISQKRGCKAGMLSIAVFVKYEQLSLLGMLELLFLVIHRIVPSSKTFSTWKVLRKYLSSASKSLSTLRISE